MNDPAVIMLKTEECEFKFLDKNKKLVDNLNKDCIMGYVEASEKECPFRTQYPTIRIISLKSIVENNFETFQSLLKNNFA